MTLSFTEAFEGLSTSWLYLSREPLYAHTDTLSLVYPVR